MLLHFTDYGYDGVEFQEFVRMKSQKGLKPPDNVGIHLSKPIPHLGKYKSKLVPASFVKPAICGVKIARSVFSNSPAVGGSTARTSRATPAISSSFNAFVRSVSSINPPLAKLMK